MVQIEHVKQKFFLKKSVLINCHIFEFSGIKRFHTL
jgi:hypothetical protein